MDTELQFSGWEYKRAEGEHQPMLNAKMDCPCDTCPLADQCAEDGTECKAFRNWNDLGWFKLGEEGRLIKKIGAYDK